MSGVGGVGRCQNRGLRGFEGWVGILLLVVRVFSVRCDVGGGGILRLTPSETERLIAFHFDVQL